MSVYGVSADASSSGLALGVVVVVVDNCPVWVLVPRTRFRSCRRSANTPDSRASSLNPLIFEQGSLTEVESYQ